MPIICRTKPKLRIWMNVAAYGRTSSVALENVRKASSSGGYAATAAMTIQSTMPSVTVLPRLISASFLRPSPKRSAASALPPLPTSIASAINTTMSGAATVAADRPISPMACPRKMESIRLYAAFTNMPRIAGMANSVMSRGRDAVPMRATRSSPCDLRAGVPLGEEGVPAEASGVDFKDWPRCSSCAVICIPHASIVSFAIFRKHTIVCISAHKKEQFITPTARKRRQAEVEAGGRGTRSGPLMLRRAPRATHAADCIAGHACCDVRRDHAQHGVHRGARAR